MRLLNGFILTSQSLLLVAVVLLGLISLLLYTVYLYALSDYWVTTLLLEIVEGGD